jgi:hypothetical protein
MRIASHSHQGQPDVSDRDHRHRRPTEAPSISCANSFMVSGTPSSNLKPLPHSRTKPRHMVDTGIHLSGHSRSPKDGFCYDPPPAARRAAPCSPAGWPHAGNARCDPHATGTGSPGNWLRRSGRPVLLRCGRRCRAAIARCRTASCR